MKHLLQHLNTGDLELAEVPCPKIRSNQMLVRSHVSLVSAGTERMLLEFGQATLLGKIRKQPEKVRQVFEKIRTDGLLTTLEAVKAKLEQPIPLGYCNVGTVIEAGSEVSDFKPGDRVVSNGPHAEVILASQTLSAKIPAGVDDEAAAFAVIGAVALQGIRLLQPTLGERVVVTGLGLVGLLAVQLLRANGCQVIGVDYDRKRLDVAQIFGAETIDLGVGMDPVEATRALSEDKGVDGVLITASTKSSDPVRQAAQMCRQRGRVILVGVTGLDLSREEFYRKELTFQVSCSYGPGRYDPNYEKGQDYPYGHVRWTAHRNIKAVLELMADGKIDIKPLISYRFPFSKAPDAYKKLRDNSQAIGILLKYSEPANTTVASEVARSVVISKPAHSTTDELSIGMLGAGAYAKRVLLPALHKAKATFKTIVSGQGVSGTLAGRKYGFLESTTDEDRVFSDPEINVIVIASRNDSHAGFVCQALQAGKHVFVEKPLAITREQLAQVEDHYTARCDTGNVPLVMVGFNRRFSTHIRKIKTLLDTIHESKHIVITVNSGILPADHWLQDSAIGGGRIIGEGCHFVDLLRFLVGHPATDIQAASMRSKTEDTISFMLTFADGSCGAVHYLSNGHNSFPKERVEVFCAGRILQLDNYRYLHGYGWPGFKRMRTWKQDKGHTEEVAQFISAIKQGTASPIPFEELVEVTRTSFDIAERRKKYLPI